MLQKQRMYGIGKRKGLLQRLSVTMRVHPCTKEAIGNEKCRTHPVARADCDDHRAGHQIREEGSREKTRAAGLACSRFFIMYLFCQAITLDREVRRV